MEHIKGKDNLILDLLSRPSISCVMENPIRLKVLPMIFMFQPVDPDKFLSERIPLELSRSISSTTLNNITLKKLFEYQYNLIRTYGPEFLTSLGFHPENPFSCIFSFLNQSPERDFFWPKELLILF